MIRKPSPEEYNDREPSQIVFWVIGIYVGLFGIADQRYQNNLNVLLSIYSVYVDQLGDKVQTEILQSFINLQEREIPTKVEFTDPISIIKSFYTETPNEEIVDNISIIAPHYFNENVFHIRNLKAVSPIYWETAYDASIINSSADIFVLNKYGQKSTSELIKSADVSLDRGVFKYHTMVNNDFKSARILLGSYFDVFILDDTKLGSLFLERLKGSAIFGVSNSGTVEIINSYIRTNDYIKTANFSIGSSIITDANITADSIFFMSDTRVFAEDEYGIELNKNFFSNVSLTYDYSDLSLENNLFYNCMINGEKTTNIEQIDIEWLDKFSLYAHGTLLKNVLMEPLDSLMIHRE
ncbi:MAG: hypothetical protein RIF33_18415 [Cyclobacteriaceae bacterium]